MSRSAPFDPEMEAMYKAVVALNNMGISLLKQKKILDGVDIFNQAIVGMKTLLRIRSAGDGIDSSKSALSCLALLQGLEEKINFASQLLASATIAKNGIRPSDDETLLLEVSGSDWAAVRYINVGGNESFSSALSYGSSSRGRGENQTIVIRIEPRDFESCKERDFEAESAIVLNNFAVAYCMMATHAEENHDPCRAADFRTRAERILHLAYMALTARSDVVEDEDGLRGVLLIGLFVMHNLATMASSMAVDDMDETSQDVNMEDEHEYYIGQLRQMRENLEQLFEGEPRESTSSMAPAA